MNTQHTRRALAIALAVVLSLTSFTAQAAWLFGGFGEADELKTQPTEESGVLRVKLSSLNAPVALGLTFSGQYTVDGDKGFRFARDTEVSVAVDGENLLLTVGGLTIDMGTTIDFVRHSVKEGQTNGIHIHENKYDTIYNGDLRLINEDGAISPIVMIDIDEYLYGVVPFEMSDSFPIEALKAQAVAARTYALSRRAANASRNYDVVDTTADQVFRGFNPDYENAIAAVDATRYVAGRYRDAYATCYFSASNGGQTAMPAQIWGYDGDYGYLDVRDDPYDLENPSSVVKRLDIQADGAKIDGAIKKRLREGLAPQLAQLGYDEFTIERIDGIEPVEPKFEGGNRMFTKLRFTLSIVGREINEAGESADLPLEQKLTVDLDFYNDLKPNFGLKINAANCEMVSVVEHLPEGAEEGALPDSFSIESRRFGHGVGMSQRGAQQMADAHNKTWREILNFYYPNMQLVKMEFQAHELSAIDALPASVGYARSRPTPKPTPAPLPALADGEYYAQTRLSSKASTLNVREQPSTDAQIVGALSSGQRLIVMKEAGEGWAEVKTAELRGYVSMEFLVKEQPE